MKALFRRIRIAVGACASAPAPISKERIAETWQPDRTCDGQKTGAAPDMLPSWRAPGHGGAGLFAGGGLPPNDPRATGPTGRVYGQSRPRNPDGPKPPAPEGAVAPRTGAVPPAAPPNSPQALAERAKNPAAANIVAVVRQFEDPVPPEVASGGLDLVTLMFNYHDLGWIGADRTLMNRAVFAALKSGGMYVIADHSGRPGTGISESGTLHRVERRWYAGNRSRGFRLAAEAISCAIPRPTRSQHARAAATKGRFLLKFVSPSARGFLMIAAPTGFCHRCDTFTRAGSHARCRAGNSNLSVNAGADVLKAGGHAFARQWRRVSSRDS